MPASVVHKYPLGFGEQILELPASAELLHVGEQSNGLYVWALVNPMWATRPRRLLVIATGVSFHRAWPMEHLQTVQMTNGIVAHAFDCGYADMPTTPPSPA